MWEWHGDGLDTGEWLGMALMMLIVWVPILIIVGLLLRGLVGMRPTGGSETSDSAVEEARRAYARGDIDREHFLEVMQELHEHPARPR